jgi:hypothetical protein
MTKLTTKRKRRKTTEPGDIVAYHRRPRHKGEILCHNHVIHTSWMVHGVNGFRWFTCRAGGDWMLCPCGWRPDLGRHYALPEHVKWARRMRKHLGSQEAFDRYVAKRAPEAKIRAIVFRAGGIEFRY